LPKYPFLSAEWIEEARKIRDEYRGRAQQVAHVVRMNQVVTDVPFGEGTVRTYIDTTAGSLDLELGELEDPDLTVTMDYLTAKALLVEGDPQAGMQAFMAGKIKVDGDMSKLMALQATPPDPTSQEIASRIRSITQD
jgi:putative sterol carrier protein